MLFDSLQSPAPTNAGRRVAVERILADVEIERGQVGVHERGQRGDDACEVKIIVSLTNLEVEFEELVKHQSLESGHRRMADRNPGLAMPQSSKHPTNSCCAACGKLSVTAFRISGPMR